MKLGVVLVFVCACGVETGEMEVEQAEQGSPCTLIDSVGVERGEIEVGENVLVRCEGLAAASDHRFVVRESGKEVLSAALVSDGKGVIEPALLWPDVGLGRSKTELFSFQTLEDAHAALAGRQLVVEVWSGKTVVAKTPFAIAKQLVGARIEPADESGAPHRALRENEALWIALRNQPAGEVDLVLVAAQADWQKGDRIAAALDDADQPIVQRVKLDGKPLVMTRLAKTPPAGDYQIVALPEDRPYGDQRVYDPATDRLSDRLLATVIIRRDVVGHLPFVFGADIAGRRLDIAPHFQFIDNFALGMPVAGALDPGPDDGGARKARFYVIPHRTPAEWRSSTALADVTGHVVELVLRAEGIAGNRVMLWPDAVAGDYDVIADFGNNADDPAAFVSDARFDSGRDMIDGYARVGFRVSADPSRPGAHAIASTSYAEGNFLIVDPIEPSNSVTQPMNAEVRYPVGEAAHPLVVVLHGQGLAYQGYGYLLDQLASQGFVAASISCNSIPDYNHPIDLYTTCLFHYLGRIAAKTAEPGPLLGRIDLSRIALIGHSRGGNAVALAEQRNRSEVRGWAIRAVASIAPTDGEHPVVEAPYLCIYGSNDGDVGRFSGFPYSGNGTGFKIYDRARSAKAMVFVRDANHNYFNTVNGSEHSSPMAIQLPRADHEAIARGYLTAFLQWQLLGRIEQRDYFTNALPLPELHHVFVRNQYAAAPAGTHLVDDFTGLDAFHNRLGGAVGYGDLDSYLVGGLGALERSAPHEQRGLKVRWNATAPRSPAYVTNLPSGTRDLRSYRTLSFRVGQTYGYMGAGLSEYGLPPVVTYASELDRGVVSPSLVTNLATRAYVTVSTSTPVTVLTPGTRWRLDAGGDNVFTLERVLQVSSGGGTYYNLRVWRAGAEVNRRHRDQDVTIRLTNSDGTSRVIRASALTRIAYPDRPVALPNDSELDFMRTLAALQTVRIPLSAWTLPYPGADVVDLADIASITLGFPNASGELIVDDIAFDRD